MYGPEIAEDCCYPLRSLQVGSTSHNLARQVMASMATTAGPTISNVRAPNPAPASSFVPAPGRPVPPQPSGATAQVSPSAIPSPQLSISDVLEKVSVIRDSRALNHACVHVYVPHARFLGRSMDFFSIEVLPAFAGWKAAWLCARGVLRNEQTFGEDVLACELKWPCGSAHPAFVLADGRLVLHAPAEVLCRGVAANLGYRKGVRDLTVVSMCQRLTKVEIESGVRGTVLGAVEAANNRRRVSHVVGLALNSSDPVGSGDEPRYSCMMFGAEADGEEVVLGKAEIEMFAPQLLREYEARVGKTLSYAQGREILPYLEKLFARARANDLIVRGAIRAACDDFGSERGTGSVVLKEGIQALDAIGGALETAASAAKKDAGEAEAKPAGVAACAAAPSGGPMV